MSFPAEYRGQCAECGGGIEPGQLIESHDDPGAYQHVTCPEAPDTRADRQALESGLCRRCGTFHPGEC